MSFLHPSQTDSGSRQPWRRGRSSGSPSFWRPVDDPLAWCFPGDFLGLARLIGCRLRWHVIVPLWVGVETVTALVSDSMGLPHVGAMLGWFILLAMVREVARIWFARLLGSEQDTILLWPLGGITPGAMPGVRRELQSELGGVALNIVLVPVLGLGMVLSGLPKEMLYFNVLYLLHPGTPATIPGTAPQLIAWWGYYANWVLLAANLLIPVFPFDAARLLRLAVTGRLGHTRATLLTTRVAMFVACAMFIYGAADDQARMMAVAAFGAAASWIEFRRAEFITRAPDERRGVTPPDADLEPPVTPLAGTHMPDLDEILGKISRDGIGTLTPLEREILAAETDRRRKN